MCILVLMHAFNAVTGTLKGHSTQNETSPTPRFVGSLIMMVKTVFRYDLPNPPKSTPPPKGESPTFQFRCLARRNMCAHIAFVDGGQWLTTAVFFAFTWKMICLVVLGYPGDSNNTRIKADYVP